MERIEWGRHGPRVVLVHGDVFDSPAIFAAMEPLAANHRLVLVNRRGLAPASSAGGSAAMRRRLTLAGRDVVLHEALH
jgi:hypothetical protein